MPADFLFPRLNRILYLSQEAYIDKVILQFGLSNGTPVNTPIETSLLPESDTDYRCSPDQRIFYQRVVGSLMYIILVTRGDIA